MSNLLVEHRGPVTLLTLDRPEVHNSVDAELAVALGEAIETFAADNGYCFAGGMELACWCDFRIASENAEFGALNRRWGVPFSDGGTQRFSRIMGQGNALWLIETGVRIDARRAQAIGLVQKSCLAGGHCLGLSSW